MVTRASEGERRGMEREKRGGRKGVRMREKGGKEEGIEKENEEESSIVKRQRRESIHRIVVSENKKEKADCLCLEEP